MQRFVAVGLLFVSSNISIADDHPLSEARRAEMQAGWERKVRELSEAIADRPDEVSLYSRRGDALFFLGRFEDAVADYEKMVEIDSSLDASHWRRGIAYFYAGEFEKAAGQFERYHLFDNVDRENGIWRYLSQFKAEGRERARDGLLLYEKDDRPPFPDVYRLFAGDIEPAEILQRIEDADISDDQRETRLFYAELYIGMNHAVEGEQEAAVEHLRKAVANEWAPTAGGGPTYMWQVGRLQYELLTSPPDDDARTE